MTSNPNRMDLEQRRQAARHVIEYGADEGDLSVERPPLVEPTLMADLSNRLDFPEGLAPVPDLDDQHPDPEDPLPVADILVTTWTIAELDALADVMTPGFSRRQWHYYRRRFDDEYAGKIRRGAPASRNRRLGSWRMTTIGSHRVLCYKSELHLNQDGIELPDGTVTLPVREMLEQLIAEVKPKLVITVGTSGATYRSHTLGDVVVTRGAKFRLSDEFTNAPFNQATYKSIWKVPTEHFDRAEAMMKEFADDLREPLFVPPTKLYDYSGVPIQPPTNDPDIKLDGRDFDDFLPILTTDFFEFGTSDNNLWEEGCAVEMGDAVLGMVCSEMDDPPDWLVIRNVSDPQINGEVPRSPVNMQTHWAIWYYEKYGYTTSLMSALTTWAIVAGYKEK